MTGPLLGATMGRADKLHTSVADGSHIIPADVVSAMGDGNSVAGAAHLSRMFPHSSMMHGLKDGGHVKVQLSDGEFSVHPHDVAHVGGGSIEEGHRKLNDWTLHVRHEDIERRKRLPPPVT